MEERPEGVKSLNTNVKKVDDELLKADAIGGISVSVNDNQLTAEVNDPESPESAANQPVADKSLGLKLDRSVDLQVDASAVKSEIPGDASLQEMNAAESIEAKQMQMSSDQPNDLKAIEDINANEGLADAVEASVKVSQSVVSDTDEKTSNNESYESKPQEAEGKFSIVESKLLEAEDQATENVPNKAELQHNERENPESTELKLAFSEAEVKSLDGVNVDKEHEQHDKAEQDKQRISIELSPNAPTLESEAVSSNEIDGGRQMELSDSFKAEEGMEDVHVVSLAKDLPALDNPELLKDFKDYNKYKSSFPLDLGSSEEICSVKDDTVAASEVTQSFVGIGRSDGSISSVALDVSGDQVSEEKVAVAAEGITDSSGLPSNLDTFECGVSSIPSSNGLQEPDDSSKSSLSSYQEDAKQSTKVDDPVIERTEETSFTMEVENKGVHPENELFANNETTPVAISCLSEAIQTTVTLGESDHGEHEKVGTECPIVAGGETEKERTEEKLARVSEGDKTICPVGGHNDRAIVTDTTVDENRPEIFHEASEDVSISNDAKALESASATGLDPKVISGCHVKEPAGLNSRVVDTDLSNRVVDTELNNHVVDTDLNNRVVDNSPAGDVLKSATGVISSASQNESYDKLIKQNETVSAVDTPISSCSRADSLDANWGSISVLSTQSESTAIPDAETTDTQRLEKLEHDLQKPTSGSEECHLDKSDVYEPPSFMTLVESGESSANKKATASEIETQLNAQQPKTESLKAGWFPSITNVVNESQGRKKNEEIIAKVTNWSTGKQQHTPLKSLLGEARSPNVKQVPPSANKKDETASTKTTTVNSILSSEAPTAVSKEAEKEWNSPARYPVDIKKEKRKTKPYWVPFVCCSSVHQDA
uniref:Putative dentin sialophosphoprotein-like n=1 Tax=Solanum chacoense TaxID=4108 RepID=A0A0V0IWW6_SOLCH